MLVPETAVTGLAPASAREPGCKTEPSPSLRTNFAWTLAGNIVYAACQWLMLIVLAKLCPPDQVGLFTLGLAITAPIIMFANLQLRSVQATDVWAAFEFQDYAGLRGMTTALAMAIIVGIAAFAAVQSRSWELAIVIIAIGGSKALEGFSDVVHGHLQRREQMFIIARSMMLKGAASIVLMIFALMLSPTAPGAAIAVAAGSGLTLVLYDLPIIRRIGGPGASPLGLLSWKPSRRKVSLVAMAFPLGLVQALVSLSANIPRYFLERTAGTAQLGIFSALASLVVVGQTAVSALGNVVSPRLAGYYAAGQNVRYRNLLLGTIGIGVGLGLAGIGVAVTFGRSVLLLLFRPEYAEFKGALVILMVGAMIAYVAWFAGFGLTAAQLFRVQIPLLAVTCIAAWGAAAFLVPMHGVNGAALSFTLSMAVQAAGAGLILWRAMRYRSRVSQ